MNVKVFGPNLSSKGQRLGNLHVHATTCDDCKRYGPGKPFGGEDTAAKAEQIEASTRQELVVAIYADHMAETVYPDWRDYDDLYVAPCVLLDEPPAAIVEVDVGEVEQQVRANVKAARDMLTSREAEQRKMVAKYDRELAAAGKRFDKVKGNPDDEPSDKEKEAWKAVEQSNSRYLSSYDAHASTLAKIRAIDDPEHVARLIADATSRRPGKTTSRRNNMSAATTTTRAAKKDVPKAIVDRIVKLIDEGNGVTKVASILADEKVAAPTGSGWYGRAVYNIYVKATGKTVGAARKGGAALKSKAVAKNPPAATTKLPAASKKAPAATGKRAPVSAAAKATALGKKSTKADPKPSARKATTGRKTAAARKATAKK